jgi:glutaredoxin 3
VSWAACELDKEAGKDIEKALARMVGRSPPVPAVFIGGKVVGTTGQVMALHLRGREARAAPARGRCAVAVMTSCDRAN